MPDSIATKTLKPVANFLKTLKKLNNSLLLSAISGGADSTALLAILDNLRSEFDYTLAAVYLDHGLLKEEFTLSAREHVFRLTRDLKIPLFFKKIAPGVIKKQAEQSKLSLEAVAREYRYCFFDQVIKEQKVAYLATGHHLGDQIETLIMRFFQGSGSAGLRGIPQLRGPYIRPLLTIRSDDLRGYLASRQLTYWSDPSNASSRFLRNQVRKRLLPIVEQTFPGYEKSLVRLAQKMVVNRDLAIRQSALPQWLPHQNGFKINSDFFWNQPPQARLDSFYAILNKTQPRLKRATFSGLKILWQEKKPDGGKALQIGEYKLIINNKFVFWLPDIVPRQKKRYFNVIRSGSLVCWFGERIKVTDRVPENSNKVLLSLRQVDTEAPLVLRCRRPGDRIEFGFGRQEIKKILNQKQFSLEERQRAPILVDRKGLVAILGSVVGRPNIIAARALAKNKKHDLFFLKVGECSDFRK